MATEPTAEIEAPGRLALIGGGAVASAFARTLAECGRPSPLLWTRTADGGSELVERGLCERAENLSDLVGEAETVLLCVSDRAVEPLATQLAEAAVGSRVDSPRGQVCLHTSGYHDSSVLSALRERGFAIGSIHPLVPLPRTGEPSVRGCWFAVEGEELARERALGMVQVFEGHHLQLGTGPEDKRAYHASAALLSNGLVALFDAARKAGQSGTQSGDDWSEAFLALLRRTVSNLEQETPAQALTGPVLRGDAEVVAGHLEILGARGGDSSRQVYLELSKIMLGLARARGTDGAARIAEILGESREG